ncbi:hypothetical protein INR49_023638 [Caranx melampygus]|nr:hypothetical protein INR49_023638 [Caranx melampygus]
MYKERTSEKSMNQELPRASAGKNLDYSKGDLIGANLSLDDRVIKTNADVKALTYCDLQCINLKGLYEVLDLYPEYSHHFVQDIQQDLTLEEVKARLSTAALGAQSVVRRNGRVVQGYPSINEAQEEHEDDEEEEDEDEAMSVSLSLERNRAVNLRDTGGKSLLSRPSQKTTGQSSGRSRKKIQEITLATLDPSNLSPRIVDGTEDSEGTESSLAFSFSTTRACPVSEPTSASASATDMLQISTAELAAKAEETRGQLRHLDQQVSSLGREVADLGRVMRRMAQLMENIMSSVPPPSVDCPTQNSPAHHTFLPHPNPPQSYPSPAQTASVWTDTPMSLPSSPLIIPSNTVQYATWTPSHTDPRISSWGTALCPAQLHPPPPAQQPFSYSLTCLPRPTAHRRSPTTKTGLVAPSGQGYTVHLRGPGEMRALIRHLGVLLELD